MLARYSLCLPTVWMQAICCLCNWNGPWNKPIYAIVDSPERIGHCVDVTHLVVITFCGQITVQELACLYLLHTHLQRQNNRTPECKVQMQLVYDTPVQKS